MLKSMDYRIFGVVATGEEALDMVRKSRPDLILMDIMLKGEMDGTETAKLIHDRFQLPIIFMTAYSDNDLLEQAKKSEPFGYLIKPFEELELYATIELALHKNRMEAELKKHHEEITFLSRSAMRFVEMSTGEDIYKYIGENLKRLAGDSIVNLNSYNDTTGILQGELILGLNQKLLDLLGGDPGRMSYRLSEVAYSELLTGRLHRVPGGVHKMGLGKISNDIAAKLEQVFKIKHIYSIGFAWGGVLYGNATVIMFGGKDIANQEEIERFLQQAAIAIRRHQAEEKLAVSEEKYHTIFNSANDIIVLIDGQGKIIDINQKITEFGSYKREDLIGRQLEDLKGIICKKSLPKVLRKYKRRLKGFNDPPYEVEVYKNNGERADIEISAAVIQKDGVIIGDLAILRDVTARNLAQKKIKDSENKYKAIFNGANDIMILLDREGNLIDANKKLIEFGGYSREDLIGKNLAELELIVGKDGMSVIIENFKKRMLGIDTPKYEAVLLKKDGQQAIVEINASLLMQGEERVGDLAILRDITYRKRMEEELRESAATLKIQKESLEQKTSALKELVDQIEREKQQIKNDVIANVDKILIPLLKKLKGRTGKIKPRDIEVFEYQLNNMASSFGRQISDQTLKLTPREIEICSMIKSGLSSKEISELLYISLKTVSNHREKIRKKLKITNRSINLISYLQRLP